MSVKKDLKDLKIVELKDQLNTLGLDNRGNKSALIERLRLASESKVDELNEINISSNSDLNFHQTDLNYLVKQLKSENILLVEKLKIMTEENRRLKVIIDKYEPAIQVIDPMSFSNIGKVRDSHTPTSPNASTSPTNQMESENDVFLVNTPPVIRSAPLLSCLPSLTSAVSPVITQKMVPNIKTNVLILGDSHARGIGPLFTNNSESDKFNILSIFKPNAKVKDVTSEIKSLTKDFNFNDYIIIMAGTNDILCNQNLGDIFKLFLYLKNVVNYTNVIVSAVPYNMKILNLNLSIFKLNKFLYNICEKNFNFYFFDTNLVISNSFYSPDKTHINITGKKIIVSNLIRLIKHNIDSQNINCTIPTIVTNRFSAKNNNNKNFLTGHKIFHLDKC